MINAGTRRDALAALLGLGVASSPAALAGPLQAALAAPLRLPDTALRFNRVLHRTLGGRDGITVQRSWTMQCHRQARGIVVTGQQVAAEVSAPPHLAQLAAIERARDASGMFPLLLSDTGLILTPGGPSAGQDDDTAAALHAAEALIAQQPVPADERARYRLYLAQVHQAGTSLLDTLPRDLLFPSGIPIQRNEVVALPGGLSGSFALHYTAHPQPAAPWLARAERQVVTRIEGLERSASEVWTLGLE